MMTLHNTRYYNLIMTRYCWIDYVYMLLYLWLIHNYFQQYIPEGGMSGVRLSRSVCQIGKNAWLKEIKRNKRYCTIPLDDLHLQDNSPLLDEQIIQKDEYLRTRKAMLALKEPYRNIFILHAVSGIKLKEIASLYGRTESWARVTYYRARMQIVEEVMK